MIERLRRHFAANVVGYISLMVAVVGLPTAWAIGRNSVGASQIKKNAVGSSEIKKGAVGSSEAKNLLASDFKPGQLPAGPQGEQGPPGEAGIARAAGASSWSADCNEGLSAGDVMVRVGSFCIDKYEASVWDSPTGGTQLITEAQIDAACPNNGQPAGARRLRQLLRPLGPRRRARRASSPGSRPSRRSPTPASTCRPTPSGRWRSPGRPTLGRRPAADCNSARAAGSR